MTGLDDLTQSLVALERRASALERSSQLKRASVDVGDGTSLAVGPALLDGSRASEQLSIALKQVVVAADYASDGIVRIFYTNAPPDAGPGGSYGLAHPGDLWLNVDTGGLSKCAPTTYLWVPVSSAAAAASVAGAASALSTADGQIVSFWQASPPSPTVDYPDGFRVGVGDLWFRTTANLTAYLWNGAAWKQVLPDAAQSGNYVPGSSGWSLAANGDAEVNSLQARGDVTVSYDAAPLGSLSLKEYLSKRAAWQLASPKMPVTTFRTINSQTNTFLTECGWTYDVGLIIHSGQQDAAYMRIVAYLDLSCQQSGLPLVAELGYYNAAAGVANETVLSGQLIYAGTTGSRAIVSQAWDVGLAGGGWGGGLGADVGYGLGNNTYTIRLRVRLASGTVPTPTPTYRVNDIHSSLAYDVQGTYVLGG